MAERVCIIGAGLAGLSAAATLAERGFRVLLLEARQRFGGRAGSFTEAGSGQVVDACQHVSMGCCTNLAHFWRRLGVAHFLRPQPCLYFVTPDRRVSRFKADAWPAPFHLARAFLSAHYLSLAEKLRIAWGLSRLERADAGADVPFTDWLAAHRQSPRAVDRFWGLVLVSALNEEPARVGLRYARKVFVDGFLRHRRGFEVEVPAVPLDRLYGPELQQWLHRHGVEVRFGARVRRLVLSRGRVQAVALAGYPDGEDGGPAGGQEELVEADWFVSAVPFRRLPELLPGPELAAEPYFANLSRLETSPITSVHLWFDRPVMRLPHAVLVDGLGQWLFNRGEVAPGEHYLQVVVSAARALRALDRAAVQQNIVAEVQALFPAAGAARLVRARVITEPHATFSAVPGVDRWRPPQGSPVPNLLVAGDWTATGWPATMEGAVRSGALAAEALLQRLGRPRRLLQPDL